MNNSTLTRALVPAVALVTVAAGLAAAGTAQASSAPRESITAFLTAPHPAALRRLALAHRLSRAQRLDRLHRLVPGSVEHAAVDAELRGDGFTISRSTAWSVTAAGPVNTVSTLFGTRPSARTASIRAAAGVLPRIPAALRTRVSAVFPTVGGPAPFHPQGTGALAGPDFRNADTPATVAPSTGENDSGATIATLQLADFHGGNDDAAKDLVTYATQHNLPNPVQTGQYKAITVDGGPSRADDLGTGDVEVDLDQQSILSTAPSANQHAYFAPNTNAGFGDVFSAVYDDVTGNADATAPDPDITALSVSWGECESGWGAKAIHTMEPIMESLVAAGVTIFASSGDDGIYDCGSTTGTGVDDTQADVDYPGSSPVVVSTGGTHLTAPASKPNTGTNWTEKAWTCTGPVSCESEEGSGGTGGGASGSAYSSGSSDGFRGFAAPKYQTAGIDDAPFAGAKKRLVPDIAADGDPDSGFVIYTSDLAGGGGSHDPVIGGTSLASPISAAQLTNALADKGITTGVGDIHVALYSAYRGTQSLAATNRRKVFRDVVAGSNGSASTKGSDPSVSAQKGYDTTTGLGGVLWSALIPYLNATGNPRVSGALTYTGEHSATTPLRVTATWAARQGTDTRLVRGATVTVRRVGGATVFTGHRKVGTHRFTAKPGATYRLTIQATDFAGHVKRSTADLVIPVDDRQMTMSGGWRTVSNPNDVAGSHAVSLRKGARATVTARGRSFAVQAHKGPSFGYLGVFRGGKLIKRVDLYAPRLGIQRYPVFSTSTASDRTLTFRALGRKAPASSGRAVDVDAVYVTQ